jgi:hypothetical protein
MRILLLPVIIIVTISVNAQPVFYQQAYGTEEQGANYFTLLNDGSCIFAGTSLDSTYNTRSYHLLKTDVSGTQIWDREIGDAFNAYGSAITVLSAGNLMMIGTHGNPVAPVVAEASILDTAGNITSSLTYPPVDGWGTTGVGIVPTNDSSAVISIYTDGFISTNFYSIFRLNSDLTPRWTDFVSFDLSLTNTHSISIDSLQNIYSMAYYDFYPYSSNLIFRASDIRKHDALGNLLSDSLYEFDCITASVAATSDSGVIICGTQDTTGQHDIVLIHLDNSGQVAWVKKYGTGYDEDGVQALQTQDGGYAIIATVVDTTVSGLHDILLIKTNAAGDSLWSAQFGGALDESAVHMVNTPDNNYIILGYTTSYNDRHILVIKADSAGNIPVAYDLNSPGQNQCAGDTVQLMILPAPNSTSSISWSTGDTTTAINVAASGNYFATITDTAGNVYQTPVRSFLFSPVPEVQLGTDTQIICSGTILSNPITDPLTFTYQWTLDGVPVQGAPDPFLYPSVPGTYMLTINSLCGTDSGSVFVDSIYALPVLPVITTPPFSEICEGDSLLLTINSQNGNSFQWFFADDVGSTAIAGATDTLYYVNTQGLYYVSTSDQNGCIAYSDPVYVTFDLDPAFIYTTGPNSFCQGGQVTLFVQDGSSFLWNTGDTTRMINVSTTGDYYVTFIDDMGCPKATDTISISVLPLPVVSLGPDTMFCNNVVYILDAGPGFNSYSWNDGSSNQTLSAFTGSSVNDTNIYSVFVTDTNNCINYDSVTVIFDVCAGLNTIFSTEFSLYPNPIFSGQHLIIHTSRKEKMTLVLTDVSGRVVHMSDFYSDLEISTALPGGFYICHFMNEKGLVFSHKLVVGK